MKSLKVDEETFRKLEERAKQKGLTIMDYVSHLVRLAVQDDK